MRKALFVSMCAVVFLQVVALSPLRGQAYMLYQSSYAAETPYIITLKNGDIMVVFTEGRHINEDSELKYSIYSQAEKKWSPFRVAVKKRFSSSFPQLAIDDEGDVHMVYQDGDSSANREICYANFSNGTWSNSFLAYESPGVNSTWPRIKVEDNLIYILWSHNYDPMIGQMDLTMIVNPKGGSWPVDRRLRKTISASPWDVSVHGEFDVRNKNIYAAWLDDSHAPGWWAIYYNEGIYNPTKNDWDFKTPQHLFPNEPTQYYPSLTIDPSGGVHIFYSYKNGPFFHAMKKGNKWSQPKPISREGTSHTLIAFIKYANGLLHAVWRESSAQGENIVYGRGLPDGTWATPITVATGTEPNYPGLTVDHNGDVHVVWTFGPDDFRRDIWYAKVMLPGTPPQAVIEASPRSGVVPLTVSFDASKSTDPDGKIVDYRWDFGDGTTGSGKTVTHTYNNKGKYKVILSVIDNDFRIGTAEVEIAASTGEPFASFKASSTRGMVPLTVTFDASESTDVDGQIVSYRWDFGDGNTGTGQIATHTYTTGGRFTAKLTVTDNDGKTDSTSIQVVAFQKPTAKFTAAPTYGVLPLKVDFDASESHDVDGQIVSYQWDFGDGITGEGKTVSHTFSNPGNFLVILTATDNDGYTGTASRIIEVFDRPAAPTQVTVKTVVNKTLFFTDYINQVSWQNNPKNSGLFTVSKFRVYRKAKGGDSSQFIQVGEVNGSTFQYDDRKFANAQEAGNYEYAVTAVDDKGKESSLSGSASPAGTAVSTRTKIGPTDGIIGKKDN